MPPRVMRAKMHYLTEVETAAMLRATKDTAPCLPLLLAVGTGMRRGELLGLSWGDAVLDGGTITVSRTLQEAYGAVAFKKPKTTKSRRRIYGLRRARIGCVRSAPLVTRLRIP